MRGKGLNLIAPLSTALLLLSLVFSKIVPALILLFILVLSISSPLFTGSNELSVECRLSSEEIREGEDAVVTYELATARRVSLCTFSLSLPSSLRQERIRKTLLLSGRQSIKVTLRSVPRGRHSIPSATFILSDLIDISRHEFLSSPLVLISRPKVERLKTGEMEIRNTMPFPGSTISPFRGGGSEFHSIRPYMEGDNLRNVNWKASARTQELMVNEFLSERSGTVIFVLDLKLIYSDTPLTERFNERIIRAGISLIYRAMYERNPVGLIALTHRATIVRPSTGRHHYVRMERALTELSLPHGESAFRISRVPSIFLNTMAQYVVLSPVADEGTREDIAQLMRQERDVVLFVPLLQSDPAEMNTADSIVREILRLRQLSSVTALRPLGRVATWEGDSVYEAVRSLSIASRAVIRR